MIREFKETDIEEIIETWFLSSSLAHPFLEDSFMEKEKQNIREIYLPNTKTWVFEVSEKVVGFISMMGNEVGAIFVRPEFHGKRIGKNLMDLVAGLYGELEVEVFAENLIGRAFYDRYGFKVYKEHFHKLTGHKLLRMKFNS